MEPPATWTTFAIASEDLSGEVIGRTDHSTPVSEGDVIGLAGPAGARRYRVERVTQVLSRVDYRDFRSKAALSS